MWGQTKTGRPTGVFLEDMMLSGNTAQSTYSHMHLLTKHVGEDKHSNIRLVRIITSGNAYLGQLLIKGHPLGILCKTQRWTSNPFQKRQMGIPARKWSCLQLPGEQHHVASCMPGLPEADLMRTTKQSCSPMTGASSRSDLLQVRVCHRSFSCLGICRAICCPILLHTSPSPLKVHCPALSAPESLFG